MTNLEGRIEVKKSSKKMSQVQNHYQTIKVMTVDSPVYHYQLYRVLVILS